MIDSPLSNNLPAEIANALVTVPRALVPASVKALDRLIGSAVDIPVAWLAQKKAKIDAQTEAFKLVEASIAKAAAGQAGADQATIERAVDVLVRKAYRKQVNRDAVAAAMVADLRKEPEQPATEHPPTPETVLDDDWLNVFERYAEDASTDRMQKLWGRVLAGEVRKPGRYSMRTLRFLSEFSQSDGLTFADFCANAFGDGAPTKLVRPNADEDIRTLIYLESAGLVQGASGMGLTRTMTFDANGNSFVAEGNLVIMFQGQPGVKITEPIYALTPLGQELLSLLPGRDARSSARKVAEALRSQATHACLLAIIDQNQRVLPIEVLWQEAPSVSTPIVEGSPPVN